MVHSISANQYSDRVTDLAVEAQNQIEEKIALASTVTVPYYDLSQSSRSGYYIHTEIIDNTTDDTVPDKLFRVKVIVMWSDEQNVFRQHDFITYVPRP